MTNFTEEKLVELTPTVFLNVVNENLSENYREVAVVGEVSSFKINQGKWVFFDLKDDESSISCFMPLWSLRMPIEDGMKVMAVGTPKITKWGKFSFTVEMIKPVGEGSLKKAFEKLKLKLTNEGLFDSAKKRGIPVDLNTIGVISSTQAAGYADFIKILNERWGGMRVVVAHTQVQGLDAPDQIIRALDYFNQRSEVQIIAIIRGGGSADDLSVFNDEKLVRTIAASKIPIITGIGHEVDESLADLAADVRASTPSNVAEMLTKERKVEILRIKKTMVRTGKDVVERIEHTRKENYGKVEKISNGLIGKYIEPMMKLNQDKMEKCLKIIRDKYLLFENSIRHKIKLLEVLNPEKVLSQGYAILTGKISPGEDIRITTLKQEIEATIKEIYERK